MKKKFYSICLSILLLLTLAPSAFAAQPVSFDALAEQEVLSQSSIATFSQSFDAMSNDEFDKTIAELVSSASDFEVLKTNLRACGVELKAVEEDTYQSTITRSLEDSDAKIVVSAAQRGGEDYYHLVTSLTFTTYELYPSSKDGVTIFFDSTKAQYIDYNEGTGFRLKSGQQATQGALVFNFDDSLLSMFNQGYKDVFYGAVYVKPYSSAAVTFGADYAHTYGDSSFNITGGSINFTFGPVMSGSVTVNFSVADENERIWQIGALDKF